MQRIIDVLLRFRNGILYVLLLLFSIYFLTQRSFYHQTQLSKLSLYLTGNIHEFRQEITGYFKLKQQNKKLILENEKLKFEILKNNHLSPSNKSAINSIDYLPFSITPAQIIYNQKQIARNFVIINKGLNDGIEVEMGVIGGQGILGIVEQVSPSYASVISLLNLDLGVNVRLKKSAVFGSISWRGKSPYKMQIDDIVATANVALGDTIITSGRSSYFPSGIPIGSISAIEKKNSQGFYVIEIQLFESPIEMDNVYILKNKDRNEIQSLIRKETP